MNLSNNILFTAPQRSLEFSRSEFIGAIDIVREAAQTTGEVREVRTAMIDHHRKLNPKLLAGLDNISSELGNISSSVSEIANTTSAILTEVELVNSNLVNIEATLDAGFELISGQLEEGNKLLSDMVSILSSPVASQAKEYLNRGKEYYRDDLFEEAEDDFIKVVELDQGNYCAWYLIGLIRCQSAGDRDGAVAAFEKCNRYSSVRSKYHYSRSLFQQALLFNRVDNANEKAIERLMLSIEADSDNTQSHFFAAELLAASGQFKEAIQHLTICVGIDAIYYLKSSQSKMLVDSGVHDSLFNQLVYSLHSSNSSLSKLLEASNGLNNELANYSDGTIGFGSAFSTFTSLNTATSKNDYLAQRELQRIGSELAQALRAKVDSSKQWLSNYVEEARNKMEAESAAVIDEAKKELSVKIGTVTQIMAAVFVGGMIILLLFEIAEAFKKSPLDGIATIFLFALFGIVLFWIARACGLAVSSIFGVFISASVNTKAKNLQTKIKKETNKEITSRDKYSKDYIKQLDEFKADLEPF